MNTTKQLIEQLEKESGKKVTLKEGKTISIDGIVDKILDIRYEGEMGEFEVKGEEIKIMAMDGGPSAVINISELKRQVAKLTPQQIKGIFNDDYDDYLDDIVDNAVLTELDDYM